MRLLLLVAIAGFAGGFAAGCSSPHEDNPGDLAVEVFLPDGVALDAVTYRLTGNRIAPIVEVVPVRGMPTTTFVLFSGIPAGRGYQVAVTAISSDGLTNCAAVASADVRANHTTSLAMPLVCTTRTGMVIVVATFHCSLISSLVAAPMTTSVGGEIDLRAVAEGDGGSVSFAWSAGSGRFSDPTAGATVFTCTSPGTAPITVTVTSGQCSDHVTVSVSCVPASG
jgi:hypothetical protein